MFSGTILSRRKEPSPDLRLPRSCWAFYDQVNGRKPVGAIADALGFSDAETFAVVQQLQSYDLVEEAIVSYADYQEAAEETDPSTDTVKQAADDTGAVEAGAEPEPAQSAAEPSGDPSGDGAAKTQPIEPPSGASAESDTDELDAPTEASGGADSQPHEDEGYGTRIQQAPAIDLDALWTWLEESVDNVKDYKNTQAFILMEASGPLSEIGVETMEDLQALKTCDDPDVVEALEQAVESNVNERIPQTCYQ
jgi:chemotaxis protein histidine kinase CheA